MVRTLPLLAALGLSACSGTALDDLRLGVDFATSPGARTVLSQTPSVYRVGLQRVALLGNSSFEVLVTDGPSDPAVFAFTAGDDATVSLVPDDVVLPSSAFDTVELSVVYLEMDLAFRLDADGSMVDRTLRIWFESDGTHLPGDVTVVSDGTEGWAFGPGNVDNDPSLLGLAERSAAYTGGGEWTEGRPLSEGGPFGLASFWDAALREPFRVDVPIPTGVDPKATVQVRVADTWHYSDVAEDGIYDWPTDYGADWHMEFPAFEIPDDG